MNISGRLIDAFLALEETRRFAAAANRCHMSAPAFSQAIKRLEDQVGTRLFDRDTRNVQLTHEGEVFAQGARRIAAEIQLSIGQLRDLAAGTAGRVTVAAPPTLASVWLPQQMASYRKKWPGVSLRLLDVVSDACIDLVASGKVDFGLNANPGKSKDLEITLLLNEKLFLLCRKDSELGAKRHIHLKDLRGASYIHMVRTGSIWQQMHEWLERAGAVDSGMEVLQFSTLAGLASNGFGVSLIPQFALQLCARPSLVAIPVADRSAVRPIYLLKRKGSLSVAATTMWNQLRDNIPNIEY